MQRFLWRVFELGMVLVITSACTIPLLQPTPTPTGSCTLKLDATTSDEQAIRAVLAAESDLVVKQDINQLMALWADGGFVADANNTPNTEDDDELWRNKDAIRHRYVRIVFPGAPAASKPADMTLAIDEDQAVVTSTTHIGNEVSPAGDRWTLIKTNNCWQIKSLTFNLEPDKGKK